MAAILDFWIKKMSQHQTDARIGIPGANLPEKVSLYMILCALVQKLTSEIAPAAILNFTL